MSIENYYWVMVGHVVGFVMWIAGMVAVLQLLRAHSAVDAGARPGLTRVAKSTAIIMDVGALLAIACGLWMAFNYKGLPFSAFKTGGWLHVKLTLVAIFLLGTHGWARAQVKRFGRGQVREVPAWLLVVVLVAGVAIIALGAHPTLLRKH